MAKRKYRLANRQERKIDVDEGQVFDRRSPMFLSVCNRTEIRRTSRFFLVRILFLQNYFMRITTDTCHAW